MVIVRLVMLKAVLFHMPKSTISSSRGKPWDQESISPGLRANETCSRVAPLTNVGSYSGNTMSPGPLPG
jgi:hypothetical protein